jgi:hypothetical protein
VHIAQFIRKTDRPFCGSDSFRTVREESGYPDVSLDGAKSRSYLLILF